MLRKGMMFLEKEKRDVFEAIEENQAERKTTSRSYGSVKDFINQLIRRKDLDEKFFDGFYQKTPNFPGEDYVSALGGFVNRFKGFTENAESTKLRKVSELFKLLQTLFSFVNVDFFNDVLKDQFLQRNQHGEKLIAHYLDINNCLERMNTKKMFNMIPLKVWIVFIRKKLSFSVMEWFKKYLKLDMFYSPKYMSQYSASLKRCVADLLEMKLTITKRGTYVDPNKWFELIGKSDCFSFLKEQEYKNSKYSKKLISLQKKGLFKWHFDAGDNAVKSEKITHGSMSWVFPEAIRKKMSWINHQDPDSFFNLFSCSGDDDDEKRLKKESGS